MKNLMLFSLMMLVSVFAFAQKGGKNADTHIQKKVEHLTQQLNLTADQQTKVKELLTAQQASRKPKAKKGQQMTEEERTAMKAEHKAARKQFDQDMMAILTTDQQAIYKNMAKEKSQKDKAHMKGQKMEHKGGVEHRVAKMTEELNLTADQQKQMTELLNIQHANRKANGKPMKEMTDDEKAQFKADRKAERAAFDAKVEAILTPEQLAIYKKKKAEHKSDKKMDKANKQKGKASKSRAIEK